MTFKANSINDAMCQALEMKGLTETAYPDNGASVEVPYHFEKAENALIQVFDIGGVNFPKRYWKDPQVKRGEVTFVEC